MKEQISIYNNEGKVEDSEIARKMAEAQNPYEEKAKKRLFGIGSEKIKKQGESAAEKTGEKERQKLERQNDPEEKRFQEWKKSLKNKPTEELEADLDYVNRRLPRHETVLQQEIKKRELVIKLGTLLHDEWREIRKKEDGTFEPRSKVLVKTAEGKEKWFNEGDSNIPVGSQEIKKQDIANTSYESLDPHWQDDNKRAAEVAMGEVFNAIENETSLDSQSFVESASANIHEEWLKRNGWQATEIQKKPYNELPEEEKEKDRIQLKKAIEIFKAKQN